jgi:hypothetical protein
MSEEMNPVGFGNIAIRLCYVIKTLRARLNVAGN